MQNSTDDRSSLLSRRHLLAAAASVPLFRVLQSNLFASDGDSLAPRNRFPRMVHEYFVRHVRRLEQKAVRRIEQLQNKEDVEKYLSEIRQKIDQCFGPWPEKSPLNPRTTGIVERDTYRIEKIIFESRPNFLVTANLYLPKGRSFPAPGVVGTCGHSANGKAAEPYQSFAQGLARKGFVVLIYDPIGQGERLQYVDERLQPRIGTGTREHLHAGNQQFLVGEFFGTWRAWDGIRALDYLLSREEVDASHIGVTGNSGGGTMTTWLCGVEQRWTMAAPSCFITTFRRNLENELPADTEQCPPGSLSLGLDHADFLAALAPKPVIILAKERDYFDARGTERAYQRLKHLYGLMDVEESVRLFIGPGYHGYSQENREAMYAWFNRHAENESTPQESDLAIEPDETLWCTPNGQVAELDSRTVHSFTRDLAMALKEKRESGLGKLALKRHLVRVLRLRPSMRRSEAATSVPYRILRPIGSRQYPKPHAGVYAVESEPGIFSVVYRLSDEPIMSRPPASPARAILYVAHHSSDAELREEPVIRELLREDPDCAFYACDVRGIGESRPDTCGEDSFLKPYGCDYFYAIHSIMLSRPYVGQKTFDVLQVIKWLNQAGHAEIHLVGNQWGAIPATFAALLSDQVSRVTLKNALESFQVVAESEDYSWPLSSFVPGMLKDFDLPDCYRVLDEKQLRQITPYGAGAEPAPVS